MKLKIPYKDENGTWRIDGVQMVATGIEYRLAKGPHTFTESELKAAVEATDDIAIVSPRNKLGHTSEYNEALVGDAEQAFGRWENLRMGDNNQSVYGDLVGIPEWLATVYPIAYPSRSIEAGFGIETVTGKTHEMVITACVALGIRWPGCSVIEDLPLWYGAEIPEGVEIDVSEEIAATNGGGMKLGKKKDGQEALASVDISLIRRKFYNDGPGAQNYSWWVRGERFDDTDGLQFIVDMGDGDLARFPVNVSGADVTFGDPVLVTEEYPDKAVAASAVLAGMAMADPAMVIHATRAETDDRPVIATQEGASHMDDARRKQLAGKLGLPEDATEEQINTKLAENALADEPNGQQGNAQNAPAADEVGTTGPNQGEQVGEGQPTGSGPAVTVPPKPAPPPGATNDDGDVLAGVTLDRATFEELKAGAAAGATLMEESRRQRNETLVASAVSDRKIPPARKQHYLGLAERDYEGTKAFLDSLEAGAVPGAPVGSAGSTEDGSNNGAGSAAAGLPDEWFPEIARNRQASNVPKTVIQAAEA